MKYLTIFYTCLVMISYLLVVVYGNKVLNGNKSIRNAQDKQNISGCDLCELLVNSFNKGMQRTAREHFGGGDTVWEEKNLGSYATSETRLVEIQEGLCEEQQKEARGVCQTLAEVWEHHLENWWLRDRKTFPDLKQYLCETIIKACKPTLETTQRCPTGWSRVADKGCFDVDECLSNPCKRNEFCINNEGSFSCSPCDSVCDGCLGSGPEKCKRFKREREKRGIEEIVNEGKILSLNSQNLCVLLITIALVLVPCICFILVPLLTH